MIPTETMQKVWALHEQNWSDEAICRRMALKPTEVANMIMDMAKHVSEQKKARVA